MTTAEMKIAAKRSAADGVNNRAALYAALAFAEEVKLHVASLRASASELDKALAEIKRECAEYAMEHVSVFDVKPYHEEKADMWVGELSVDGTVHRFTKSKSEIKRIDGGSLTQLFLKNLPDVLKTTKLVIDTTSAKKAGWDKPEKLEPLGLCRRDTYEWKVREEPVEA